MAELAGAYADIDALQATLADSALYVRSLRQRLTELELWKKQHQQEQQTSKQQQQEQGDERHTKDQGDLTHHQL